LVGVEVDVAPIGALRPFAVRRGEHREPTLVDERFAHVVHPDRQELWRQELVGQPAHSWPRDGRPGGEGVERVVDAALNEEGEPEGQVGRRGSYRPCGPPTPHAEGDTAVV